MHVYGDLFDVLDLAERNEDLSTVEAPTSPFVKASGIFINFLLFCLCMINVFSLSMCRCYQYRYAETVQSSTPILVDLESYYNLVDMLSYAEIKCFSKTRFQAHCNHYLLQSISNNSGTNYLLPGIIPRPYIIAAKHIQQEQLRSEERRVGKEC